MNTTDDFVPRVISLHLSRKEMKREDPGNEVALMTAGNDVNSSKQLLGKKKFLPRILSPLAHTRRKRGWMQALASFEQSLTRIGSNGYEN